MRVRILAALAAVVVLAGVAPAQFFPYAVSPDGTQAGVGYDAAGAHAAVRPAGGIVSLMADPAGFTVQSVYCISGNDRYVGGTAGGWYTAHGPGFWFTTFGLVPVVWDTATGLPAVHADALPAFTFTCTVDAVAADGSGVGRAWTWFSPFAPVPISWGPAGGP
jgi:hypothetical protein